MKLALWILWLGLCLAECGLPAARAQVLPLPPFSMNRRSSAAYMDSTAVLARQRYQHLLALPRTAQNDTLRFETLHFLSGLYKWWYSRRDSATYFSNELIDQARASKNLFYEVTGTITLADYYQSGQRNTPLALKLNLDLLRTLPAAPTYHLIRYRVNLNLGDLYGLAKDYPTALRYLNQARQIVTRELARAPLKTTNDFRMEVEQRLGALYKQQGNFDKSEFHYLAAEQLAITGSSSDGQAFVFDDLAELYLKYQHYRQALNYAKKAEAIWNRTKTPDESKSWGTLACVYAGLGQDELARHYAEQVLRLPRPTKFVREQAYSALYQVYEHQRDWQKRALYYEKYIAARDTIASDQRSLDLTAILKQAELDQLALQSRQAQLLQTQSLLTVQKQAELDRLRATSRADSLARRTQLIDQQRLLERERTQEARNTMLRQRAGHRLAQQAFADETRQQQQIRLGLLIGLTTLLLFTVALGLSYRKIQRQQYQIQQFNTGLERTVQDRTAELLTANDELRRANLAIRETDTRIILSLETERQRLAADLHDDLGGTLATLRRRWTDIRRSVQDPVAAGQIDDLEPMIQKSTDDLRRIAHNLMPPEFARLGLHSALEQLVRSQPDKPVRFTFISSGPEQKLPIDTELNVYRILSELIQNVNKHARAQRAAIQVLYHTDRLMVTVEDDGVGNRVTASTDESVGIGLKTSKLRAEYIGATLWREPSEAGTLVVLDLPYQPLHASPSTNPGSAD